MGDRMISFEEYDRYSTPLAQQMQRISLIGPRFLEAINIARMSNTHPKLIEEAIEFGRQLSGRPGEGALEVYRDLDSNLQTARMFYSRWQGDASNGRRIVDVAGEISLELKRMKDLVDMTPPHVMSEIKRRLAYGRGNQYDFPGSTVLMIVVFSGGIMLRYFEVITLSWAMVLPLSFGAAVIAASAVSTIFNAR
jgi:hypothetical protein